MRRLSLACARRKGEHSIYGEGGFVTIHEDKKRILFQLQIRLMLHERPRWKGDENHLVIFSDVNVTLRQTIIGGLEEGEEK